MRVWGLGFSFDLGLRVLALRFSFDLDPNHPGKVPRRVWQKASSRLKLVAAMSVSDSALLEVLDSPPQNQLLTLQRALTDLEAPNPLNYGIYLKL